MAYRSRMLNISCILNLLSNHLFILGLLTFIALIAPSVGTEYDENELIENIESQILTCTTIARLRNVEMKYHLHSHPISYGSGSGQQAVTALKSDTDSGSLWMFKEAMGDQMWQTGDKILCGDKVRLEHANTSKNLHSHSFQSPVSGRQEVSAFGDDGDGDMGDNWIIQCNGKSTGDDIDGKTEFYLQHVLSKQYLFTDRYSMYDRNNCRNCPIIGQGELSTIGTKTRNGLWKFVGGYFYSQNENSEGYGNHYF